jgi:hypothetical protein
MNTRRVSVWSAAVVALLVAASLTRGARAADAAGIYKGSYASYSAGGDYGTVTILINDQGATTCDFYSTPNGYGRITTGGSVAATAPFLAMSCADAGISNGGEWYAVSDSSSLAGGSISGTWTSAVGVMNGVPPPTGSFEATYVSALTAIAPAAMAGFWDDGFGGFTILPAGAGLVITYIGVNTAAYTVAGQPYGPVMGSPLWLVSDVGPTTIFPGTAIILNMYTPAGPTTDQPVPSTVVPWGSLSITFLDCHSATASLTGPITQFPPMYLHMLAGVAGAPGC